MADEMILCDAYKTDAKADTYLLVDKKTGLDKVPEALLQQFPAPKLVTTFKLTRARKLARFDATQVLAAIRDKGYFLQLPPQKDAQLTSISAKNEKLQR